MICRTFALISFSFLSLSGCVIIDTPPHLPGVDVVGDNGTVAGCFCGDNVCNSTTCNENTLTCAVDCGFCGDSVCQKGETSVNCYVDCHFCGDGICDNFRGENGSTCYYDCYDDDVDSTSADIPDVSDSGTGGSEELCTFASDFGCACTEDGDCNSGPCIERFSINGGVGKFCSRSCTVTCPSAYQCAIRNGNLVCVPKNAPCQPCSTNSDCPLGSDATCTTFDDVRAQYGSIVSGLPQGKYCRSLCNTPFDCISNDAPEPSCFNHRCVPSITGCSCTTEWSNAGLSTDCTATVGSSTCPGVERCSFSGANPVLLSCAATTTGC